MNSELKQSVIKELLHYQTFPPGWDGYKGNCFTSKFINEVVEVTQIVFQFFEEKNVSPSEVVPGPGSDGRVDLEINLNDRTLVFTLDPNEDRISVYKKDGDKQDEFYIDNTLGLIEKHLDWLCRKEV